MGSPEGISGPSSDDCSGSGCVPGSGFPFQYNIFGPYDMQWLTFTSGRTGNSNTFGNDEYWAAKSKELYNAHGAFEEYDKLVGNPSQMFQKWLQHPSRTRTTTRWCRR